MLQYTTPTHEHTVHGVDLTPYEVYVSYRQGRNRLDIPADSVTFDGSNTIVTVSLTQQQTGQFKAGTAKVQINWVMPNDRRDAVYVKDTDVFENILDKVVRYGS